MKKLLIIDTFNFLHRAYHALPKTFRGPDGQPTNAIYGFTSMLINVLKVFDIVYVMTNGGFSTEVIANRMYKEMFLFRNYGRASAIAILLLLFIIPMIVINVQRFREQEATR